LQADQDGVAVLPCFVLGCSAGMVLRTIGVCQRQHQVMQNRPWTYVVAIAIGGLSLYLKTAFPDLID